MTVPLYAVLVEQDENAPPPWPRLVVDELITLKAAGWEWERAWSIATAQHPPPLTWRRAVAGDETPVDFFRRHCMAAWHGLPGAKPCAHCGVFPCTCHVVTFGAAA